MRVTVIRKKKKEEGLSAVKLFLFERSRRCFIQESDGNFS